MTNADTRITIYVAWTIRIALLLLYIPVQILSTVVESAHRLDLWATAVVMQSTKPWEDCDRRSQFRCNGLQAALGNSSSAQVR